MGIKYAAKPHIADIATQGWRASCAKRRGFGVSRDASTGEQTCFVVSTALLSARLVDDANAGAASIDKPDAACSPVPPHDMAAL
jgi:hypothetical protein